MKANNPSTVKVQETNQSTNLSISEEDFDLLARIVRAEAQTEPFEGKVAVASVVLNRVESPLFPDTIREVIYQRGQFQPVSNGQINKPADKESIRAVHAALSDMRHIAKGSLFFYNPTIATSRWLDSRETTVIIGQHVFKN
nr:cell wall hydrolase [Bacillus mesophilus]